MKGGILVQFVQFSDSGKGGLVLGNRSLSRVTDFLKKSSH